MHLDSEFQAATFTCSFLSFRCCDLLVFGWNQTAIFVLGEFEFPAISQMYPPTYLSVDTSKEKVLFVGCFQFMFFWVQKPPDDSRNTMILQETTHFPFQ
jgi:hypothetical protein